MESIRRQSLVARRSEGMVSLNQGVQEVLSCLCPGRHLLTLHHGEDNRIELTAAFLSQGISRGERCVFFAGEKLGEQSLRQLNEQVPGFGDHLLRGDVLLIPEQLTGGSATAAGIGTTISELADKAVREGYTGLCLAAEMTWLLGVLGEPMDFLPFLEDLDSGLLPARVTLLSQFREDAFPPELIFNVLRKHPVIVIGDGVFVNPFHSPPDAQDTRLPRQARAAAGSAPAGEPGAHRRSGAHQGWLPEALATLLEILPSPILVNYDRRQRANSCLRVLLEDPSLAGRDVLAELSGLAPGTQQTLEFALSDGRTFSFRCIDLDQDNPLRLTVGRETTPVQAPEPGSAGRAYVRFLDALPLGFLEVDSQGRVASANERVACLLACPREKITGRTYLDLVHSLDRSTAALWLARNSQETAPLEMRLTSRREECWVSARTTPSLSPGLTGIIWEDINDRKKYEVLQLLSQELVTAQDRLQFLSTRDALTGLFNRQYFEEEIRRLQNPRFSPVSIIIVDVDGLKPINDNFGHPRGDELLQTAALVLKKPFRETDMVARIGGDEFAVVLPHTPYELAQSRREEILKEVRDHNAAFGGPPLSLSVGVATSALDGPSLEETIKQADDDMYRFKLASSVYLSMARKDLLTRSRDSGADGLEARLLPALGGIPGSRVDEEDADEAGRDAPMLS